MKQNIKEATVKKRIIALLRKAQDSHPDLYWKSMSERYNSGIPDFFVAYQGTVLWIEAKGQKGKPTPTQLHEAEKLGRAGIYVALWHPDAAGRDVIEPLFLLEFNSETYNILNILLKGFPP